MRSGDNLFLWTLCLTSGWRKRRTSGFHLEGWGRPGLFRAGLCSWRSPSTGALLPAVLEGDPAGAPGRVHHGDLRAPEGDWEEKPQAGGGGRGGHSQLRQGGRVHEQATHARRLVAAGQPLEVPGGRRLGG